MKPELPPGWKMSGQMEQGEEGTTHYQAMLTTPQVRFSQVKKVLPRAHIEVARNKKALALYCHKEDTRVAEVPDVKSEFVDMFKYQDMVADKWDTEEFEEWVAERVKRCRPFCTNELALEYVDYLVAQDIEKGQRAVEFIAINPMWRSSWKKFWRSIIVRRDARNDALRQTQDSAESVDTS